jgi:ribonuclease HII
MAKLCGIDEAGRGPLAGDLVIAGVSNRWANGLKKNLRKKRERLYPQIIKNSKYHIVSFSPKEIDEIGLSACLSRGLESI